MIEEPFIFFIVLISSLGLSSFLLSEKAGSIQKVAMRLFFIGVVIHELSHYVMSIVVGIPPERIAIKWRNESNGERNPQGYVKIKRKASFLQAIVIGLAPLYISTWLIFLSIEVIFNPAFTPLIRIFAGFLCISLFLTAAPSSGDLRQITGSFREDPSNSWYQVFLISISMVILWLILLYTRIVFILDVFHYLAIAGLYLTLKFSFILIKKIVVKLSSRKLKGPSRVGVRRFTRSYHEFEEPLEEG